MHPQIGVTCSYLIVRKESGYEHPRLGLDARFCDAIYSAGGEPVIIPPTENAAYLLRVLESLDGVILIGGHDVPPKRYGAAAHPETKPLLERRVVSDFAVIRYADEHELPLLAICCGIQELTRLSWRDASSASARSAC